MNKKFEEWFLTHDVDKNTDLNSHNGTYFYTTTKMIYKLWQAIYEVPERASTKGMNDRDFLASVHAKLRTEHGYDPTDPIMQRLLAITINTDPTKYTMRGGGH